MTAIVTAPNNRMVLEGVSWTTYRGLIRDLESEPGKRLTYDRGTLEIMVPLPPHERYKSRRDFYSLLLMVKRLLL